MNPSHLNVNHAYLLSILARRHPADHVADTDRWKLIFDAYDELVWVCPECDEREFGSGG